MKLAGSYAFEAPKGTVWDALFDAEILAKTLPGCEKLEREGDTFKGELNVKMGPVQGKFQGKVDISDVKDQESYTMVVDGRGPAGFVKANARLGVVSDGSNTRLEYDSDIQVGGRIASVGQRLLDASSRAIVKQSLDGLHQQVKALAARRAAADAAALPETVSSPESPALSSSPIEAKAESRGASAPMPAAPLREALPREALPARTAAPEAPAPLGPSQAAFAFGVAKEVTKELFPLRTVLIVVGALTLAWVIYRIVGSG